MILLLLILESEADRTLLSGLFTACYHRMRGVALAILRTPDAAEDAVQDTFVRCMDRMDTLRALPEQARATYLLTATKHNALTRLKAGGREGVPVEELELADPSASVEERVIDSLTVAEVKEAFKKLPVSLKDVLRYKYLMELSDGEIARTLGVSKSTVRVYLMRARRAVLKLCKEADHA